MAYQTFSNPRDIYYGVGAIESLAGLPVKRVLLVTDSGLRASGVVAHVESLLKGRSAEVRVFDQVEQDPSRNTVNRICEMAREFKPDAFVGLGGGSSIDAGKAAWVFYEHPDMIAMPLLQVQAVVSGRTLRHKAIYIAVPTTSGSGSEVTKVAVVTDLDETPPLKVGLTSPHIRPDVAIVDPVLAVSMPASVTAHTGFDALVHAVECYALNPPSDLVDSQCAWAAETIFEWLPEAVRNGHNMPAREKMHIAALQAGMAFSNGKLGIVHILSHELSAVFHIPHGKANAYMLGPCLAHLYPTHGNRLARLARLIGFGGDQDRSRIENLFNRIEGLKRTIGIPAALNAEIEAADFNDRLDELVLSYSYYMGKRLAAFSDEQKRAGGWPLTEDRVRQLYRQAFEGSRPPFGS